MIKNAREVAYDVLEDVAKNDAYSNLVLPKHIAENELDSRDAGLVTELVAGTLRMQGLLDAIIEKAGDREMARIDPPIRDVLRLGAYQILFMRIPDHAAVSATVDLAGYVRVRSAGGFVNAILRRIAEKDLEAWIELVVENQTDALEVLATKYSHPRWIVSALRDALGSHKTELEDLLAKDNQRPEITGVSRVGVGLVSDFVEDGSKSGRYSPFAFTINQMPQNLPQIRNGEAGVQDEGSQIVALLTAFSTISGSDKQWLDLCAGPGGKAALLKYLANERNAEITAVELQPHRAKLIDNALSPVAGKHKTIIADGTDEKFATAGFDRVLVDAPCTGLGVLRRRAESRWRKLPKDVGALAKLQRNLLENALKAVRPGGVVAYATCSPHLAETEFVIEDVLAAHKNVRLLSINDAIASVPGLRNSEELKTQGPFLRLWPHIHDTDGMFLALLTRD